ncbi:UNVERIFIED_CONTAM: hypothetical protein Cloal_0746 [Acetivibrio alkalicellulosi]
MKQSSIGKLFFLFCIFLIITTVFFGCSNNTSQYRLQLNEIFNSMEALDEFYHEMVLTFEGGNTHRSKIWTKDGMIRSESEMENEVFISIIHDKYSYTLMPNEKTGIKIENDSDSISSGIFDVDSFISNLDLDNTKGISLEKYNGIDCYVVLQDISDVKVKTWLNKDTGLPIKVESTSKNTASNFVMEFLDFKIGGVSDDFFVIPSDYEIIELNW